MSSSALIEQVASSFTLAKGPLVFDGNSFAKNANLMVGKSKGLHLTLRGFQVAGVFEATKYGKVKARIALSQEDKNLMDLIHRRLVAQVPVCLGPNVKVGVPYFNGELSVGVRNAGVRKGTLQPETVMVFTPDGNMIELPWEQINEEYLTKSAPKAIHGHLNIWARKVEDDWTQVNYYFTLESIEY